MKSPVQKTGFLFSLIDFQNPDLCSSIKPPPWPVSTQAILNSKPKLMLINQAGILSMLETVQISRSSFVGRLLNDEKQKMLEEYVEQGGKLMSSIVSCLVDDTVLRDLTLILDLDRSNQANPKLNC